MNLKTLLSFDWNAFAVREAGRAISGVALPIGIGLLVHHPLGGMVMASGAMSVGFGSFQQLYRSRVSPMLFASVGICLSIFVGTLGRHFSVGTMGHTLPGIVLLAGLWAGTCGLLACLSPGALWIGQQCVVALLVASAYPVSFGPAAARAGLILAGGLLQTMIIVSLWRLQKFPQRSVAADPDVSPTGLEALTRLKNNITLKTETGRYALRLMGTTMVAVGVHHLWGLPNGYWIPMTALFVLKPDFDQTFRRAWERVLGTCLGAGLATLLIAVVRPTHPVIGIFVVLFAWLAYALQKVNYALYAVCITSYIAFLLSFAGLPGKTIVLYRTLNTALGGGLALLTYTHLLLRKRLRLRND